MLLCVALGATLLAPHKFDFYARGPYNAAVPRPEAILGYGSGERQTVYHDQDLVVNAIARAAADRVQVIQYGKSAEGPPLRVLAISSPENMRRIDQIRKTQDDLANGKDVPIGDQPAIVWINECIHGNEPASFESGMWLIYNLAASRNPQVVDQLKHTVVIVNPSYNPDGHERFAVWYDSIATGSPMEESPEHHEPGILYGRLNHYRFDMNRDRVSMSQQESQQEVKEFLRWHPLIYADQHGQVSSYFLPPNPMAVNGEVDRARIGHWTDVLGRAAGKFFDTQGWQYYVKDSFDLYYAGYLDSWSCLSGAIGMTNETDGGYAISQTRDDGSILTLRDGMAKHFSAALAYVAAAASNRKPLIESFAKFKKDSVTGKSAGKFQRVVATGSKESLRDLQTVLQRHGIHSGFSAAPFSQADAHNYWTAKKESQAFPAGSLVVDIAQSQGALAKALLEPGEDFEPEFTKEQVRRQSVRKKPDGYETDTGAEFYDVTGWSLIYGHELSAWWCETAPSVRVEPDIAEVKPPKLGKSAIGWSLTYRDQRDILAVFDLMAQGVRVQISPKSMKLGSKSYDPGAFLFLTSRNEDDLATLLQESQRAHGVSFDAIDAGFPESDRYSPGSENVRSLKKPNVAVLFTTGENPTDFGGAWFALEKVFKLPFTPISSLSGDLSKFSCILIPRSFFGGSVPTKLADWVREGGCAISLGSMEWGNSDFSKLEEVKLDGKPPTDLPGSIFLAELEPRSHLSYGYPHNGSAKIPIAVPIAGSRFFKVKPEGGAAVSLSSDEKSKKLLSGWEWPDETEKALTGTVWLQEERVGRGSVVVFASDPTERALYPGLYKLLLNAILFGPSN